VGHHRSALLHARAHTFTVLLNFLHENKDSELSIVDMAKITSIKPEDILFTLQYLNVIKYVDHQYVLCATPEIMETKRKRLVRVPHVLSSSVSRTQTLPSSVHPCAECQARPHL